MIESASRRREEERRSSTAKGRFGTAAAKAW